MVHLRSENVPNDATSFCAIFCRFLLFMQFWETMIETANSSLQKECTSKNNTVIPLSKFGGFNYLPYLCAIQIKEKGLWQTMNTESCL